MLDDPSDRIAALFEVRAGPLQALLDEADLRRIGRSGVVLVDRVYVAVRAADWSTVPGIISDLAVRSDENAFTVSFTSHHRAGDLDFEWQGAVQGSPDGRITWRMDGLALSAFDYCRIGFCVLHPDTLAGAPYRAVIADGEARGHLPRLIAPQILAGGSVVPPIPAFTALSVTSPTGETVHLASGGEPFEMEDQRNWTDASFKSYIPPIQPGYPYSVAAGQRFSQGISISIDEGRPTRQTAPPAPRVEHSVRLGGPVRVDLGPPTGQGLPLIGIGLPGPAVEVDAGAVELIGSLRPDHLRVEVWLDSPDVRRLFDRSVRHARQLGCALEVALFADSKETGAIRRVVEQLAEEPVARWAVFDAATAYTGSTSAGTVRSVREALDVGSPGATLVAGTAADFVRLNRGRTLFDGVDALTWAIAPTAHAHDDRSVMENALAQGITVETARAFGAGRGLCLGPVELSRRFEAPDRRQSSLFAAAWTVASLADLCAAHPDSATYFEAAGPRGLIGASGEPSPVYYVFEHLAQMREGSLCRVSSSARRFAAGIAVEHGSGAMGLLANLTAGPLRVSLGPPAGLSAMRVLGPSGMVDARTEAQGDRLVLDLDPYAVVFVG